MADPYLERLSKSSGKHFDKARRKGTMPRPGDGRSVFMTEGQYKTVERALAKVKELTEAETMPEGLALEYICADWLAGQ